MIDPATHYHRIETADELASEKQDAVIYNLTRLEGQLSRIDMMIIMGRLNNSWWTELQHTVNSAQNFAKELRRTIESTPQ